MRCRRETRNAAAAMSARPTTPPTTPPTMAPVLDDDAGAAEADADAEAAALANLLVAARETDEVRTREVARRSEVVVALP